MDFSMISFQKVKKYTIYTIRVLSFIFAVICLVCGVVPLVFYYHINSGNIALILYAVLILFVLFFDTQRVKNKYKKALNLFKIIIIILLTICFAVGAFVSSFMIKYAFFNKPSEDGAEQNGTVVVLGYEIKEGQPSDMLKGRLDKAYEYLEKHEEAVVVVSGGQYWGGTVPESYVMRKYLIDKGIDSNRIFEENKSTNTEENILFASKIIKDNNLPEKMYIITDSFHSYRAYLFAEISGCEAKNISADIYWPYFGEYWVRDILGVLHMKLTPN